MMQKIDSHHEVQELNAIQNHRLLYNHLQFDHHS